MRFTLRNFLLALLLIVLLLSLTDKFSNDDFFFPRLGERSPSQESLPARLKKSEERFAQNPDDLKALVDRGVIYFLMGTEHTADALNAFNAAWRAGAFDKRIFYYSGILYENLSLFTESEKQYERFLKHEPGDREIRLRLARLLFRMGKWDDSISHYQKFIRENPNDTTALINLGLSYQKRYELKSQQKASPQQSQSSRKTKSKATEEKPKEVPDINAAINYLEQAKSLQPNLPEGIYASLAKLYLEKGDWEKSVAACESELKMNPNQTEALKLLTAAYENANQKEKALEIYLKLLEKDPQNKSFKQKVKALKSQLKK